jgi:hypothetical protein
MGRAHQLKTLLLSITYAGLWPNAGRQKVRCFIGHNIRVYFSTACFQISGLVWQPLLSHWPAAYLCSALFASKRNPSQRQLPVRVAINEQWFARCSVET